MKDLYLIRHAKSSWDFPELTDLERPLNKRGKKDAPEMGRRLVHQGIVPDLILTSPARRAFSTAKRIAKATQYLKEEIQVIKGLYMADGERLLQIVNQQDNAINKLVIIGHNPGLTSFANTLSETEIDNIPTCGVFAVQFAVESWATIKQAQGRLSFFDYPKKNKEEKN